MSTRYLTDEFGNRLTDELGNFLITEDIPDPIVQDFPTVNPKRLPRGQVYHPHGWHFVRSAEK